MALPVYAFDGATHTGYSGTTNASGQAALVLPNGSYRFRADSGGRQYFSGATNHCTIPGCTSASIAFAPPSQTTAINYAYDPINRLSVTTRQSPATLMTMPTANRFVGALVLCYNAARLDVPRALGRAAKMKRSPVQTLNRYDS